MHSRVHLYICQTTHAEMRGCCNVSAGRGAHFCTAKSALAFLYALIVENEGSGSAGGAAPSAGGNGKGTAPGAKTSSLPLLASVTVAFKPNKSQNLEPHTTGKEEMETES